MIYLNLLFTFIFKIDVTTATSIINLSCILSVIKQYNESSELP